MAIVFDGRTEAKKIELGLAEKIKDLKAKPSMVSILVGDDPASVLYTSLKKSAAERVGIKFLVINFFESSNSDEIGKKITELNNDNSVDGIMIQLPLPEKLESKTQELINLIAQKKDVDGLSLESPFIPATVKAVMKVIYMRDPNKIKKIVVIGEKGAVGGRLIKVLKDSGFNVYGIGRNTLDKESIIVNADLIVSATGQENLVKAEMVREGAELIDVGAPKGDIDPSCYEKASFYTPVPGGIGPMTIACLLENVLEAST